MRVPAVRPLAAWGVFVRHCITMKRTPLGQNDLWVWPIIDVLLFGSVGLFLNQSSTDPGRFHSVLLGVFMYTLVQTSSLALSLLFMDETRSRNVLNLVASPLTAAEYWSGTTMAASLRVLLSGGASALACTVLYDFNPLTAGWAMPLVVVLLVSMGFAVSTLLIALQLRLGGSADNLTWVLSIVPASISGALVPLSALPAALVPIATVLPTSSAFAAGRAIVAGGGFPGSEMSLALLGLFLTTTIVTVASHRLIHTFRRRGLVTRYS